jgi:hypothetical protein
MWNANKSAQVSSICTKIVIVLIACAVLAAPQLVNSYIVYAMKDPGVRITMLVMIYTSSVPALIAMICLDRLLVNIKKKDVFVDKNVRYLRVISWCCFAVSAILFAAGFRYLLFLIIAVAAAFFGLILRVVKNVIEQAVVIKNENDFTI